MLVSSSIENMRITQAGAKVGNMTIRYGFGKGVNRGNNAASKNLKFHVWQPEQAAKSQVKQ